MRTRLLPYTALILLSFLLAILPVAIYSDLVTPVDRWQNYWPGRPSPASHYDVNNLPAPLRAEIAVFKALAIPPSLLWRMLGGIPTCYYALVADMDGSSLAEYCMLSNVPPFTLAVQHLWLAVPVYLCGLLGTFEILKLTLRKLPRWRGRITAA